MTASVTSTVRVTADRWDEGDSIRESISAAQSILARNPHARASRLSVTATVHGRRSRYSRPAGKVVVAFRLDEAVS